MRHIPSKREMRNLMEQRTGPCISLYLPTEQAGADIQQHILRLRNLIRAAESHLLLDNLPVAQVDTLLEPAWELLEHELFWLHPDDGLAVFRSADLFRAYWLPGRFTEQAIVTRHFYLRPLHPFLTDDGRFYVLALSHNHVRLTEETRLGASEVVLPEAVPRSLAGAMRDAESDNELQYQGSSSGAVVGKGRRRAAVSHGQGVGTKDQQEHLLRFFRQIDRGLHPLLADEHVPLILAGVASLFPLYREANTYAHLLEEGAPGNYDRTSLETLHEQAWSIVTPFLSQKRLEEAARCREFAATGWVAHSLREVIPAAFDGRIESLFLQADQERWGTFNPATRMLHVHQQARYNDDDLLDLAATQTLLHGGSVYVVVHADMPGEGPLAAMLRH